MSHFFFILFLRILQLTRLILSTAVSFFPFHRVIFEKRNFSDSSCYSFRQDSQVADFCFEVSSEGELEQVRPLILYYLKVEKKIELIFSSPSVESKCMDLQKKFMKQLRIFRLPLATNQLLSHWVTAPVIIFCRYDFYPELLLLKILNKKFILVSAAVKKNSWYKNNSFQFFDIVIAATSREEERFRHINSHAKIFTFDFRIARIAERLEAANQTLLQRDDLQEYLVGLKNIPIDQRIILGSAWPSDLPIFDNPLFIKDILEANIHVLILPHVIDDSHVQEIQKYLLEKGIEKQVKVLKVSGILCELYSLFKIAYVGGGYERSIHSVLEPYFAGNQVFIGPKIHRSTEYDFLAEIAPNEIHVLFHPEQFYTVYMKNRQNILNPRSRHDWVENAPKMIEKIVREIDVK